MEINKIKRYNFAKSWFSQINVLLADQTKMTTIDMVNDKEKLLDGERRTSQSLPGMKIEDRGVSMSLKITSALFYAACSFLITVVNKTVLTSYEFPSFQMLAFGQMLTTIVFLSCGKKLGIFSYPDFSWSTFSDISPLPFIYIMNVVSGLGGTKELSLPMFTMLRRFSILMTMIAEFYILGVRPNLSVKISVGLMIFGAIVAASDDLGFNLKGYALVMFADVLTASNGVYTKKILSSHKEMGKNGLMFYSALFMLPVSVLMMAWTGDIQSALAFPQWTNAFFVLQFLLSCCMGFALSYSIMLCTQNNSALTTTIIGCLKNILVTYLGMFVGGDYIFTKQNFIGINMSVIGSLLYAYVTFKPVPAKAHVKMPQTI